MNKIWRSFGAFVFLASLQTASQAQVFIKPSGQKAIPIRVQDLSVNVEIVGPIAITNWQLTTQTEGVSYGGAYDYSGTVYDLIIARPIDAKVTAFGVGPHNGRVVESATSHVVNKSLVTPRASFLASTIDPLLKSGLTSKNSFRTSIYLVNNWEQTTIHGTWVQVLSSTKGRSNYRLPLLSLKGATTRLKNLNVKVTVRDGALQNLSSSYGLPIQTKDDTRVLSFGQKNYRIVRDLDITLARKTAPLQGTLLVNPSPKKDGGHFALAIVADHDFKNPVLLRQGAVSPEAPLTKFLRVGETVVFTGDYKGAAEQLKFRLRENEETREVKTALTENLVADGLWATQKINALSLSAANRTQVINISKQYRVASPYTSWLVASAGDVSIYQRALVSTQLDPLVREYWLKFGAGQEKSPRSIRLKQTIAYISQMNGLNVEDEMYMRLGSAVGYAEAIGWYSDRKPRTKPEILLSRLYSEELKYGLKIGLKKDRDDSNPIYQIYTGRRNELYDLRGKIIAEYREPHPNYEQLKKWEYRFAQLYGSSDQDPRLDFWRAQIAARNLEAQTTAAEKSGDQQKLESLKRARIDNSRNAYFVNNIGDPPIYVSAPADALQVIAIMPDGKIKTLEYNSIQKRWEGNYDVPTTTKDADYSIQIVIVNADSTRKRYTMGFRVDTKAPTGEGKVFIGSASDKNEEKPLHLQIEHGGDVARVTALLPWGEKISLLPSTTHGKRFFANVRVPSEYVHKAVKVTYILVDRAHNLTTIEAESVSLPSS